MSTEIASAEEPVLCPWCKSTDLILTHDVEPDLEIRAINKCRGCGAFLAVMQKTTVTVHKIDGMGPTKEIRTVTCFVCQKKFAANRIVFEDGRFYCPLCYERSGDNGPHEELPQLDLDIAYEDTQKFIESSDFKELAERVQNAAPDEQNEPEYIQLPGSRTVSYCIDEDTIKLQYKGSDCNAYASDVIWDIVYSPQSKWMSRIDEILADEKNRIKKASALNQLCKAVSKGIVKIPGSDE
jgi:hypothetical protein